MSVLLFSAFMKLHAGMRSGFFAGHQDYFPVIGANTAVPSRLITAAIKKYAMIFSYPFHHSKHIVEIGFLFRMYLYRKPVTFFVVVAFKIY